MLRHRRRPDVHLDPSERVDHLFERGHVEQDDVVDLEAERLADRPDRE
jgi:hypothetical protein